MKTVQNNSEPASKKKLEKSTLVLKLERNQKDVGQLRNQLNSYICEPRTYTLFERMETLKRGLDTLSNSNLQMILTLKERKKNINDYMDNVRHQIAEFKKLQRGVEEYMKGLRGSY
ncbi:MAG: hypothetical protein AAFX53_01925 [Bacteroidota bacterium]